jgi:hypothetical protein
MLLSRLSIREITGRNRMIKKFIFYSFQEEQSNAMNYSMKITYSMKKGYPKSIWISSP